MERHCWDLMEYEGERECVHKDKIYGVHGVHEIFVRWAVSECESLGYLLKLQTPFLVLVSIFLLLVQNYCKIIDYL